ncbi:MAG: hypothetical protein JW717_09655 [Marinilabiliaceae bacterium]|nr:hypothetical protein [Marinilabiliaceae bacterium]
MKIKQFISGSIIVAGLFAFSSCESNDESEKSMAEQISEEDEAAEDILNFVEEQIDIIASVDYETLSAMSNNKSVSETKIYPDTTIIITPETVYPVTFTIDYGPENYEVIFGKGRIDSVVVLLKGKISFIKTGPHYSAGSERNTSFDEFYINNYKIEGTQSLKTKELNIDGKPLFNWSANIRITTPNNYWVTRSVDITRVMTQGSNTKLFLLDDVFTMNGDVTGYNSTGWNYVRSITDMVRKRTCRFPVSGTIDVVNSLTTFSLDYGDGECDRLATITDINDNVYNIFLGSKWIK